MHLLPQTSHNISFDDNMIQDGYHIGKMVSLLAPPSFVQPSASLFKIVRIERLQVQLIVRRTLNFHQFLNITTENQICTHRLVWQFSANYPVGVVDGMMVQLDSGNSMSATRMFPLFPFIVIEHHRCSSLDNGFFTAKEENTLQNITPMKKMTQWNVAYVTKLVFFGYSFHKRDRTPKHQDHLLTFLHINRT